MARTEVRGGQILDASVSLTADITGTLPIVNGGTGAATLPTGLLVGAGTGAITAATAGTDYTTPSSTETQTNKREVPRSTTINAPGATPTFDLNSYDEVDFTGLAATITSMTSGKTATLNNGEERMLRFKDNGTGRPITWGADYVSSGVYTLLATTVANKTHYVKLRYDSAATKLVCIGVDPTGY